MSDWHDLLRKDEFPRSNGYDPEWVMANHMGPHPLWLVEWLCERMDLRPGMRVLDLGCGKALTSIFLAREFDVQVWAGDLWMAPDHNWQRVRDMGEEHRVFPLRLEAHAFPFPEGFFDAIVSIDSYHYFGTDEMYLMYMTRYLKPGGQVGVVMPALMQPFPDGKPPAHLGEPQSHGGTFWADDCRAIKTAEFWRHLWTPDANVSYVHIDTHRHGCQLWLDFERAVVASGHNLFPAEIEALEADAGRYLGFARLTANRSAAKPMNLYNPNIGLEIERPNS